MYFSLRFDYLKITNDKNKTFGVFCGLRRWTFIIVTGNSARLTFHSDSAYSGKGYFISFIVVPNPGEFYQNDISQFLQGIGNILLKRKI